MEGMKTKTQLHQHMIQTLPHKHLLLPVVDLLCLEDDVQDDLQKRETWIGTRLTTHRMLRPTRALPANEAVGEGGLVGVGLGDGAKEEGLLMSAKHEKTSRMTR